MLRFRIPIWLRACVVALAVVAFTPDATFAESDDPPAAEAQAEAETQG